MADARTSSLGTAIAVAALCVGCTTDFDRFTPTQDAQMRSSADTGPRLPPDAGKGEAGPPGGRDAGARDDGCVPTAFYRDADGDGHGLDAAVRVACQAPDGYVATAGDCDDTCGSCHEGGVEVCDGADNDCDEKTDEQSATLCPGEYCVAGRCEPCTKATEAQDCGPSTACLERACVANKCLATPLTQCTGPSGQPGTCDNLGTCLYCGDGVWSQATEACDESVARWQGACQACAPTYFSHCNVYQSQTTCPSGETCAFTVCARTCDTVLDCPPEPSITCQDLLAGQKVCVWACPSPDASKCPDSQMLCDNANFCTFPANL